jgi:hypothetical protein
MDGEAPPLRLAAGGVRRSGVDPPPPLRSLPPVPSRPARRLTPHPPNPADRRSASTPNLRAPQPAQPWQSRQPASLQPQQRQQQRQQQQQQQGGPGARLTLAALAEAFNRRPAGAGQCAGQWGGGGGGGGGQAEVYVAAQPFTEWGNGLLARLGPEARCGPGASLLAAQVAGRLSRPNPKPRTAGRR